MRTQLQNFLRRRSGLQPAEAEVIHYSPTQPEQQSVAPTLNGQRLCVLNWNIAKNNHRLDWQRELAAIARHHNPQLFLFQEARLDLKTPDPLFWRTSSNPPLPDHSSYPSLDPSLADLTWHFAPNLLQHQQRQLFGLLTAAHAYNLSHCMLHSEHAEPGLATPKVALLAEYPLANSSQTLLTANIHSINFVRTHKFFAQLVQVEAAIAHHAGPIIFAGDFNTWRPKRMVLLEAMTNRLGLAAVDFAANCDRHRKRFLGSAPLDHIFYRGLTAMPDTAQVIAETTTSDHKPMVVTFQLG